MLYFKVEDMIKAVLFDFGDVLAEEGFRDITGFSEEMSRFIKL